MTLHSLIIGGTRGIGWELVHLLRNQGHSISVIGRSRPAEADHGLSGVHFWAADVVNGAKLPVILDEIIGRNGPINYLVFLQRYRGNGDKWEGEIDTSLTATKNVIEYLLPHFVASGDRAIVFVGSIASTHVVKNQPVGYHVAKAGLRQMAAFYAVTLGSQGIRVNCVSPIVTAKKESREFYARNEKITHVLEQAIPLGRMCTARDVVNVIGFFCSSNSAFVTGQHMLVDGGLALVAPESLARKIAGV